MIPVTAERFASLSEALNLTEPMRQALREHLVEGVPIVEVMARHHVSQSGFYAAAGRVQAILNYDAESRIVLVVHANDAAEIRRLVARQCAIWAEQRIRGERS